VIDTRAIGTTTMGVWGARVLGGLLLAAIVAACSPTTSQVEQQLDTLKEEQTPELLLARSRAFASVGDYTRAEQYLAAAIDAGADVDVALPALLRVCVAEQRYRAAIAYAEPHLSKQPDNFRLRFVVASLYVTIGEAAMAWEHLNQVAKEQPGYAEVHFAMGMLALQGDTDPVEADAHFREYLRIEPTGSHAAEARSHLLRSMP
jgi:tetratricopeptide (TPR) repeat protein